MIRKSELYEVSAGYREEVDEERTFGWRIGWRDGWREGLCEGLRAAILRTLRRFPSLPTEVSDRLAGTASQQRLEELLDIALTCPDLPTFLSQVPLPANDYSHWTPRCPRP